MIDITPIVDIFRTLPSTFAFIIIFGISFLFTAQIFAWVTPPRPKFLHAVAGGIVVGSSITWAIYYSWPLGPALLKASIVGAYGNWGYLWIISLLFLMVVLIVNTVVSWKENKPLEVIR